MIILNDALSATNVSTAITSSIRSLDILPRYRLVGENIQSILIMHFVQFSFVFNLLSMFYFFSCLHLRFFRPVLFICFCSFIVASVLYCSVSTTHSLCNCYIQFVRNSSLKAYNQQYFISQNAFVRCFYGIIYYLLSCIFFRSFLFPRSYIVVLVLIHFYACVKHDLR